MSYGPLVRAAYMAYLYGAYVCCCFLNFLGYTFGELSISELRVCSHFSSSGERSLLRRLSFENFVPQTQCFKGLLFIQNLDRVACVDKNIVPDFSLNECHVHFPLHASEIYAGFVMLDRYNSCWNREAHHYQIKQACLRR